MSNTPQQELESEHTPAAIARRISGDYHHSYLRDFIYGAIDGCVTTFAIVSGAAGAHLSTRVVVILGLVNLIADGFSMAVSNFLGTKAERQRLELARSIEEHHIDRIPQGEEQEVREIFRQKGFDGPLLEQVVRVVTGNRELWVETMLKEEWGLAVNGASPLRASLATFTAFCVVGFVPLIPYTLFIPATPGVQFGTSIVLTILSFFSIGAMKSRQGVGHWMRSGLETLLMGGAAASVAFGVGALLEKII